MSSHTPAQDRPGDSHTHPHPRTRSRQHWVGSPWGRHTGSRLLCSRTGHRRRAVGYGHTHPRLGTGPPALGSGSQQGRHSGRSPLCCHSGLARRAVALGHTHPHLLHTPSPGSQPGKHSGKSRTGSHRPLCHKVLGSACTRPHPGSRHRGEPPGTQRGTRTGSCLACSRSAPGHTAAARGGTRPRLQAPTQRLRLGQILPLTPPMPAFRGLRKDGRWGGHGRSQTWAGATLGREPAAVGQPGVGRFKA